MTILPTFYTLYEGDFWHIWSAGHIDIHDLQERNRFSVWFNDTEVHSFLFTSSMNGFDGRWDCINGWTD